MSKILDALLFVGPALALVLGLLFACASSHRLFAWKPRRFAIALAIPMLISVAGAWRLRTVEADISVVLTVIAIAVAACGRLRRAAAHVVAVVQRTRDAEPPWRHACVDIDRATVHAQQGAAAGAAHQAGEVTAGPA